MGQRLDKRKFETMEDENIPPTEKPGAVDWVGLRAEAEKLGISLSELQQRQREKQARLAKKLAHKQPSEKTAD